MIAFDRLRFDEGATLAEKAYSLSPNDILTLEMMQKVRIIQDRWPEFLELSDKATSLDPLNPGLLFTRSHAAWWFELYDVAAEAAQKFIALQPLGSDGYLLAAQAAAGLGDRKSAIDNLNLALERNHSKAGLAPLFSDAASIYQQLNMAKQAGVMIKKLEEVAANEYVTPSGFVQAYLGSEDTQMFLKWLRTAMEQGECQIACRNSLHLFRHSALKNVRDDPDFQALIRGI
jgi:tetratricopeptide (TPR) repeat protein